MTDLGRLSYDKTGRAGRTTRPGGPGPVSGDARRMSRIVEAGRRLGLTALAAFWATFGGCGSPTDVAPKGPAYRGVRVVVAAVGDAAVLSPVGAQRGEWEASRGAKCDLRDTPLGPAEAASAHVLVFRGDRLGDLVDAGALAVLPESVVQPPAKSGTESQAAPEADSLQFADVLPPFRDQVSKYGRDRMALPFGGTALVLVYNRSAFDRDADKDAAKAAKLTLQPPTTWPELDALAKFFQGRDWDGDGSNDFGIALALAADPEGVGDATFLARAASLGQHKDSYSLLFDTDSMAPRLTSPPFVEALEGVVALKASGPPGVEGFDADAARKAFRGGKVALLIDRAERASTWGGGGAKSIGVAALPGSAKVFEPLRGVWETASTPNRPSYLPFGGGWLAGVSASAKGRERDAAVDFIAYLANPETSSRLRYDPAFPVLPVRGSLVGQGLPDPRVAPGVDSRPWADAVGKTFSAARVVPGLRIPGADGYLADLSAGRVAAVSGQPAAKALDDVAKAWARRTEGLGVERQLWHYKRSLNVIPTSPKPPARTGG